MQAEKAIREGSLEIFMQKQLNMKNIYASSVNIIENAQDSLEVNNNVDAKDFFEIPLEENINRSYADPYNEVIRMIQNDENKFENLDTMRINLSLCKSSIEQNTLASLYKNLILYVKSPNLPDHQNIQNVVSHIKLLHIIIRNIDVNLELLERMRSVSYFVEISDFRLIADLYNAADQEQMVMLDSLHDEAKHGIQTLVSR